jgi:hypothetical protein
MPAFGVRLNDSEVLSGAARDARGPDARPYSRNNVISI